MMKQVTYQGMTFVPFISREQIDEQVQRLAREIKRDHGGDAPLFLCVLNGAFIFTADLFRACDIPDAEVAFIRFKSYQGTASTGQVQELMGLTEDITGRTVIIVEDIVDSGITINHLRAELERHNPREVKLASLLFKPASLQVGKAPDYVGFEIPPRFILGYGLDLDGQARNLPDIYVLKPDDAATPQ